MICHYHGWLLLPAFLIFSCTSPGQFHYYEYSITEPAIEAYVGRTDKTRLEKIEFISKWVLQNIKYTPDPPPEEWQTPEETYELRQGDCEDQAILFMFFVNKHFGYEPILILARGKEGNHALAEIEDVYYFNIREDMINYENPDKWIVYLEIGYYYALYMAEEEK